MRYLLFTILLFSFVQAEKITTVINKDPQTFIVHFDMHAIHPLPTHPTQQRNLATKRETILLDIAPNQTIMVHKTSMIVYPEDNNTYSWFGKTSDNKGDVILSVRHGKMVGSIFLGQKHYKILPHGKHFKIIQIDPSQALPLKEDSLTPPHKEKKPLPQTTPSTHHNRALERTKARDTNTDIDLLILYTKSMKSYYKSNTEATIQHLFDITQKAYRESQTGVNFHLVHIQQLPKNASLNQAKPSGDDLRELAKDGYVAYLRRQYKADIVALLTRYDQKGRCGLAFTPDTLEDQMTNAFSIIMIRNYSEGEGGYCPDTSLAHEIGHNFGCQHDRDHTHANTIFPYAYGYDIPNKFATIMSYDKPRIPYFSNPNLKDKTYDEPIGVEDREDNARTIRNTKEEIANNSEEIDESQESGDTLEEGVLSPHSDRDAYILKLGGETTFRVLHPKYSNTWGYYINIYNTKTHKNVGSCEFDCQMTLTQGKYRIVVAYSEDSTGDYYAGEGDTYKIQIATHYHSTSDGNETSNDNTTESNNTSHTSPITFPIPVMRYILK